MIISRDCLRMLRWHGSGWELGWYGLSWPSLRIARSSIKILYGAKVSFMHDEVSVKIPSGRTNPRQYAALLSSFMGDEEIKLRVKAWRAENPDIAQHWRTQRYLKD